jgi:cellulose synthase/poly-beta-1,6-N-acetylglucosamine synthase-like glycosyltransferase
MASVSVVVPTYNRHHVLGQTLQSVLAQRAADLIEVVVIDQTRSKPPEALTKLIATNPTIRYISVERPNANAARNRGAAEAKGDLLIYIDDDVLLPPGFIDAHVNRLLSDPSIGALTGPTVKSLASPVRMEDFRQEFEIDTWSAKDQFGYTSWFPGCNFSIRRAALDEAGGFDETFGRFSYCDDVDIAVRVREAGYRIAFDNRAWLAHLMVRGGGADLRPAVEKADDRARDVFRHTIYCRWKNRRMQGPTLTAALMLRGLREYLLNRPVLRRGPRCMALRFTAVLAEYAALNRRLAEGSQYVVRAAR